ARHGATFFFYFVKHGIHPYDAIKRFQWTLLPFFYQWDYFVCDCAKGGGRNISIVSLFDMSADIAKTGAQAVKPDDPILQRLGHDGLPFLNDLWFKTSQP